MDSLLFSMFPNMDYEECLLLEKALEGLSEDDKHKFLMLYRTRRQDSMTVLICILLGFCGVSGIHRLIIGDIAMGILYLFTAGLCFMGTIIDLINYKSITINYNRQKIAEVSVIMRMHK